MGVLVFLRWKDVEEPATRHGRGEEGGKPKILMAPANGECFLKSGRKHVNDTERVFIQEIVYRLMYLN